MIEIYRYRRVRLMVLDASMEETASSGFTCDSKRKPDGMAVGLSGY